MPNLTSVKWFDNDQTGAPVKNGTAGSLIALLDACLVNGFNVRTINTLSVSSGVGTGVVSIGHGYRVDDIILISGCSIAALNGEWRINSVTTTNFTFDATGVSDGSAGTPGQAKIAPLGWVKELSGTNKAVYKRSDPSATVMRLRVDDSAAQYALIRGYESMTDVDNGSGLFPTDGIIAGGYRVWRSDFANSSARKWALFGNSKIFYVYHLIGDSPWDTATVAHPAYFQFGDIKSNKAGDAYNCLISGIQSVTTSLNNTAYGYNQRGPHYRDKTSDGQCLCRSYTQVGSAMVAASVSLYSALTVSGYGYGTHPPYPDPVTGGFMCTPINCTEESGNGDETSPVRGWYPGLLSILNQRPFVHGDIITGIPALGGRRAKAFTTPGTGSIIGLMLVDIDGPW